MIQTSKTEKKRLIARAKNDPRFCFAKICSQDILTNACSFLYNDIASRKKTGETETGMQLSTGPYGGRQ